VDPNNKTNPNEEQQLDPSICLNCAAEVLSKFCTECGQSTSTARYTFRSFANEIYSKFRSINALATLRTFHALVSRPSEFVQGYLSGVRVGFTNPIAYFFYYFVIEVFVLAFLQWATGDSNFGKHGTTGLHLQAATLVSTIFWGALWWLFFRRSDLNLIENVIAAIYFVAQVNIISLIFLIIAAPFANRYPMIQSIIFSAESLLNLVYGVFFGRKLFGDPLWMLIPKQMVLSLLLVMITILVFMVDFLGSELLNTPSP